MANEYISTLSGAQMDTALMDMAQHTSEAWATGTRNGQDVATTDETYQNNAKYYAEQAGRVVPEGQAAVRYDLAQALTDTEKAQARANIDAPNPTELLDLKMLGWTVPRDFAIQNYEENGVFHQRVGRVDLGILSWTTLQGGSGYYYHWAEIPNRASGELNLICNKYITRQGNEEKTIRGNVSNARVYIIDSSYTTSSAFKTAMSGVYLYYELATEITRPIDGGEWGVKYSNPNLLMNPFFQINQRGQTSYSLTSGNVYCVDRWARNSGAGVVNVTDDGITLVNSSSALFHIKQVIDVPLSILKGKTFTISILNENGVVSHTFTFPQNPQSDIVSGVVIGQFNIYVQLDSASGLCKLLVGIPQGSANIRAVKFEEGSVSTLANDSAPDYATELLKCQQYFERIHFGNTPRTISAYANSTTEYLALLAMAKKRAVPTTISQNSLTGYCYSYGATSIGISTFIIEGYERAIRIRATQSSGTHTNLAPATLYLTGGYVDVSAEL